ncbi:hypothetical protein PCANB_000132 [Pneumocystis canis]|nr:hypothetical protein PCK1_000219 [Pneumocystis canis]KAG5439850.1 hypothetical protein PCANB_000132 [Pneumocystis canis]
MERLESIFSISGKGLRLNTKKEVEEVLKDMEKKEIREIHLNGNTLGVEACETIKEMIKRKKDTLEVFNASDIFTGRTVKEIPNALEFLLSGILECEKCHTIYLSDNAFGSIAASPLINFLSKHTPLKHLYLNNNGLGPNAGSKIAEALETLAHLQHKKTPPIFLETIVCGRNRLESASMEAWSACFRAHSSIIHVRMPQNGIRPDGIRVLLETGLSSCMQLQTLDLQDNTLALMGTKALIATLPSWSMLSELEVSDCLLSRTGGKMLAHTLSRGNHTQLKKLKLQYNEIDKAGASMLAAAIEKALPNLEILELNGNAFSDKDEAVEKIRGIFEKRGKGMLDDLADMEEPYESNHSFTSEESYREVFDDMEENVEESQHTKNNKVESDKEKEVKPLMKRGIKGLAALLRHTHINKS